MRSTNKAQSNRPKLSLHKPDETRGIPSVTEEDRTLGQYIPLLYHYNMLQDEDRVMAFREAIDLLVKPGDKVVELGGGTGILSSFAARKGAKVFCVERNLDLVDMATHLIEENGLSRNVEVIHDDAMKFVPPCPVDFVICEMLHVGLLREKQAQVIDAFKANYLHAHGGPLPVFIPEVSMLMMQPVHHCFDFAGYEAPVPMFQAPTLNQPRTRQLASFIPYANIGYSDTIAMRFDMAERFHIRNADTEMSFPQACNAVRFATQNVLAIDMKSQRAIAWPNQCLVLPISNEVPVTNEQSLSVSIAYSAGDSVESLWRSLSVALVED